MRKFMKIVEAAQRLTAWHSSFSPIEKAIPFMHVGTKEAAEARGGNMLYEFSLDVRNPLAIRDGLGETHQVEGLADYLETLLDLPMDAVDEVLMACLADRARGIPPSLAGGRSLAKLLIGKGYDFLSYTNVIEDVGSTSWVVLNPRHAVLIGKAPTTPRAPDPTTPFRQSHPDA